MERKKLVSVLELTGPVGSEPEEAERVERVKAKLREFGFGKFLLSLVGEDVPSEESKLEVRQWLEVTARCPRTLLDKDDLLRRMYGYYIIGDPAKSLEACEDALSLDLDNWIALNSKVYLLAELKRDAEILGLLHRCVAPVQPRKKKCFLGHCLQIT